MKVLVIFYSMYGHIYRMAEAVVDGAKEVDGSEVEMRRVPLRGIDDSGGRRGKDAEQERIGCGSISGEACGGDHGQACFGVNEYRATTAIHADRD